MFETLGIRPSPFAKRKVTDQNTVSLNGRKGVSAMKVRKKQIKICSVLTIVWNLKIFVIDSINNIPILYNTILISSLMTKFIIFYIIDF